MFNKCIFSIVLVFSTRALLAQGMPSVQTPTIASLNKFIESPVNTGTGIPEINIPLYTLTDKDFSIPVSLSYHAGGIKVEEASGDVGLGWTLQAGAAISRTIRGIADESGYGYYSDYGSLIKVWNYCNINPVPGYTGIYPETGEWTSGYFDKESDLYFFNVGSYSGRFIFDENRHIHLIPEQDIKIEVDGTYGSWKVITPEGDTYFLSSAEHISSIGLTSSQDNFTSAWQVDRIQTKTNSIIYYEYQGYGYVEESLESHQQLVGEFQDYNSSIYGRRLNTSYNGLQIKAIKSDNCDLLFSYATTTRQDVKSGYSMYALNNIQVKDKINNTIVKKIKFEQSYFTTTLSQPLYTVYGWTVDSYLGKRLRLDAISECDATSNCLEPISFSYNKWNPVINSLPYRVSTGRDHWGYYNGADNNIKLISNPASDTWSELSPYQNVIANREQNNDYKKAFILDEIKFPTGGTTIFKFELIPIGGGLRVKEIRNNPGNNAPAVVTRYKYESPVLTGGAPIYLQYVQDNCLQAGYDVYEHPYPACSNYLKMMYNDPVNTSGEISSNYVIHGKVIEEKPGNGRIEYVYNIDDIGNETNIGDMIIYPYILNSPIIRSGKLLQKTIYDKGENIQKNILYTYASYNRMIALNQAWRTYSKWCIQFVQGYSQISGASYLSQVDETDYDGNNMVDMTPLRNTKTLIYERNGIPPLNFSNLPVLHQFVTKETQILSNGDMTITRYKYPLDYKNEIGVSAVSDTWDINSHSIQKLIEKNQVSQPIEEIRTVEKNSLEYITGGKLLLNKYHDISITNKVILPSQLLAFNTLGNVSFSNSFFSKINKTAGNYTFSHSSNYILQTEYLQYNSRNRLVETKAKDGIYNALIWDISGNKPLAIFKNSRVKNVFFNGFEDETGINISPDAKTGLKSKLNGFQQNITGIDNGDYILTYWYKSGISWLKSENAVNVAANSFNINLAGQLDEIRFYPTTSQATTYSYIPLIGIGSVTDIADKSGSYEYDMYGRLLRQRDNDLNILKQYEYNNQVKINPLATWATTGQTRCKVCTENAAFNFPLMQKQVIDNNPASVTYQKTTWIDDVINPACISELEWINTASVPVCVTDEYGINAGSLYQEQINSNPCSDEYQSKRITYAAPYGPYQCAVPNMYAQIAILNVEYYDWCTVGEIVVNFFSNSACTHPYFYGTYDVNFQVQNSCTGNTNVTEPNCGYGSFLLPSTSYLYYNSNGMANNGVDCFLNYVLKPGTGYIPVP